MLKHTAAEKYTIDDKTAQERYGVSLAKSLERAAEFRANADSMLDSHVFHVSTNIPSFETVRDAIKANGGQVSKNMPQDIPLRPEDSATHVISCEADKKRWPIDKRVYSQELILEGCFAQKCVE